MKNLQNTSYTTDDFEDLTHFADESFDTGDVDLFAFSGVESSPLTRLKSIILSLDWEINDETLQELADELHNLQPMWENDKAAQVYLQGLAKIGRYIRNKGAYAHPNSIKLLLTFFYNFEKIVSTEDITGDDITKLLKGDIRKFKILQYQIRQTEAPATSPAEDKMQDTLVAETPDVMPGNGDAAKRVRAAILSLDWEVTKENIGHFREALTVFQQTMKSNKPAMFLLQGLQALGDYIAEEKADAHPEAFALLHDFSEALDQIKDPSASNLSQKAVQDILRDKINRLNDLKMLIAGAVQPDGYEGDEESAAELHDQEALANDGEKEGHRLDVDAPAAKSSALSTNSDFEGLETEIDSLFGIGGKNAPQDTLQEDFPLELPKTAPAREAIPSAEQEFSLSLEDDDQSATPASAATGQNETTLQGLETAIDTLFTPEPEKAPAPMDMVAESNAVASLSLDTDDLNTEKPTAAMESAHSRYPDEVLPPDAIKPLDDDLADDFIESSLSTKRGLAPALLDTNEVAGFDEEAVQMDPSMQTDLTEQLDALFADENDEEGEEISGDSQAPPQPTLQAIAPQPIATDDDEEEDDGFAPAFALADTHVEPALAGEHPGESGNIFSDRLAEVENDDSNILAIQSKLDSFFGEDEPKLIKITTATAPQTVEEVEETLFFGEDNKVAPALADVNDQPGFTAEQLQDNMENTPPDELTEKLDSLFGSSEELEMPPAPEAFSSTADNEETKEINELTLTEVARDELTPALPLDLDDEDVNDEAPALMGVDEATLEPISFTSMEEEDETPSPTLNLRIEDAPALSLDMEEPAKTSASDSSLEAEDPLATFDWEPESHPEHLSAAIAPVTEKPLMPTTEDLHIHLNELGALLPGLIQAPNAVKRASFTQLAQKMESQGLAPEQHSLLQMLSSTLGIAERLPIRNQESTAELLNTLYEGLSSAPDQAAANLPQAVMRYTGWMQDICTALPRLTEPEEQQTSAPTKSFTYNPQELYRELFELRSSIREEFAQLRREIHHRD